MFSRLNVLSSQNSHCTIRRISFTSVALIVLAGLGFSSTASAQLPPAIGQCTGDIKSMGCTANDDDASIAVLTPSSTCIAGETVDVTLSVGFANKTSASRTDTALWTSLNGYNPALPSGGLASCALGVYRETVQGNGDWPAGVTDLDEDFCGDVAGNGSVDPISNDQPYPMECIPDDSGNLTFGWLISWATNEKDNCDLADIRGSLKLTPAQCATGTYISDDTEVVGRVTVLKSAADNTDFTFDWATSAAPNTADLNPILPFTLNAGETDGVEIYTQLVAGGSSTITISERDLDGWLLTGINCPGASVIVLDNSVEVTLAYDPGNPSSADVECTFTNEVVQTNPAMRVNKTSTTGSVDSPGQVNYEYIITNLGDVPLTSVTLSDDNVDDNTVTGFSCLGVDYPIPSIAVDGSATCANSHIVTQTEIDANGSPTGDSGFLYNQVTANSVEVQNETAELSIPMVFNPLISVVKTGTLNDDDGNPGVTAGDTISYTFTVTNAGNVTLSNVNVTDPLIDVSGSAITAMAPDSFDNATFTGSYTLTQGDIDAGEFTNIATAAGSAPDDSPVSNTGSDTQTLAQAPLLGVVKTADPTTFAGEGETITYTIDVTNNGNVTLANVLVEDPLTGLSTISCDGGANPIVSMAPEATESCTATLSTTATHVSDGTIANTAVATGSSPGNTDDVTASGDASVSYSDQPNIQIVKTPSSVTYATLGETITYTFDITNTGNATLTSVLVEDPLTGLSAITCDGDANPIASIASDDSVSCSASLVITQTHLDDGSIANTATVTGSSPGNTDDVTASHSVTIDSVAEASLSVLKAADPADFTTDGELITYSITVTNDGALTVSNVQVVDLLDGMSAVTCESGANPILSMDPTDVEICTATLTTTQVHVDAGQIDNTSTATGSSPGNVDDVTASGGTSVPYAGSGDTVHVRVTKDFVDDNPGEVTVRLSCNAGLPLEADYDLADGGVVLFTVNSIQPGTTYCRVQEITGVPGYAPSFLALDPDNVAQNARSEEDGCYFDGVSGGELTCEITNSPALFTYEVTKEWDDPTGVAALGTMGEVEVNCHNVVVQGVLGNQSTTFTFYSPDEATEAYSPGSPNDADDDASTDDETFCYAMETYISDSAYVSDQGCEAPVVFEFGGDSTQGCTITNTVIFEGIPTLNQIGLMLMALMLFGVGAVSIRRIA